MELINGVEVLRDVILKNPKITGGTISGTIVAGVYTTSTNPAINAAVTTAIIDANDGVVITLTTTGNAQTIQNPTAVAVQKEFIVANDNDSTDSITVNTIVIQPGEAQKYFWDLTAWLTLEAISASQISATPHGAIAATQVQAYLDELEDEKIPTSAIGMAAGSVVQVDQAVTAWTRATTTVLGTSLNGTLSDTSEPIAAFNGVAGVTYHCRCLGAGAITHHATNLIVTQTGASIAATAAGDTFDVEMLTASTCRIKNYLKADGTPIVIGAVNVETLSGTRTLVVTDKKIQWLDPGGADRDVPLPAEELSTNLLFIILNTADGAGEDLVVKNAAAAVKATLGPGMSGIFSCDGTNWKWENATDFKTDVIAHQTILPQVNDAAKPTLAFGDGDSGFYESADDNITVGINGAAAWKFSAIYMGYDTGISSYRGAFVNNAASATVPTIIPAYGFDPDSGIGLAAADALSLIAGGVEGHRITEAAGAITHTLTGEVQGATFSNQMVNLASSQILGLMTDARFLNLLCENPAGGVMTDISMKGHNGTYAGTMTSGDRINQGSGWAIDWDGVNDYCEIADHADFSFGDGTNDVPFSLIMVAQQDATAQVRTLMSKWNEHSTGEDREWRATFTADHKAKFELFDESAAATQNPSVTSSVLATGVHMIGFTYNGIEGVDADDGMNAYVDGVLDSATKSGTQASYVAMEAGASPVWLGAYEHTDGTVTGFMTGNTMVFCIEGVELSAMDMWQAWLNIKGLYNL